jgi:hypothetical protein
MSIFSKKNIAIAVLSIISFFLFLKNQSYKSDILLKYQSIPDIPLSNSFQDAQGVIVGEISGFVKFDSIGDQPKNMRQYYVIKPIGIERGLSQSFVLEEIIKMEYLAPQSTNEYLLTVINKSNGELVLVDEYNNKFYINLEKDEVIMRDSGGDNSILITDDFEYGKFIKSWLEAR